jgi:hypothetical protein
MSMATSRAFGLFLVVVSMVTSNLVAEDDKPARFKITTKRKDDRVEVKIEKGKAIFSVHSPFGISHAVIERTDGKWPEGVVIRLHLKGLEGLRLTNGKERLDTAVSLQDGKPRVRQWKDGKEDTPLDAQSLYWMDVRINGVPPQKEAPDKGGSFEIQLPKALFDGNPKSITLNWVDFYR